MDTVSVGIVIQNLQGYCVPRGQVPCKGSEIQLACPLMEQADAAMRDVPAREAEQGAKRSAYEALALQVKDLQG